MKNVNALIKIIAREVENGNFTRKKAATVDGDSVIVSYIREGVIYAIECIITYDNFLTMTIFKVIQDSNKPKYLYNVSCQPSICEESTLSYLF